MPRSYKGQSGRIQARGAGGRFRKWTGQEFGIGACPQCQNLTLRPELPQTAFIDPRDFNARVCPRCGWDSRKSEAENARMADVLDAWDTLVTFTSYERTPKRVAWLRRTYEIEGDIDAWFENKWANVIEEYANLTSLSFEAARANLLERPVVPP